MREDQVTTPEGKPGIYGVVETAIATGVVALTEQQEVYLVGQYRYATETYSWEIIEGGSKSGENAIDAIRRELQEEAGLTAQRLFQLGAAFHTTNCISSETAVLYLAFGLGSTSASPDGTEVLQVQKMPLSDAVAMVHRGEITDSLSIVGLLRAQRFFERGGF